VLDFLRLLWAIDHRLQSASKYMVARLGITGPQRLVLRIVGRFPGIAAGRIATILHVHPSTLTGVLRRLEHQQLIRRRPDPRDGRRALLGLTAAGRTLDLRLEGTIEAAVERALAQVDGRQLRAARRVLSLLSETLAECVAQGRQRVSTAGEASSPLASSETVSRERRT
jgi:DNA-binding MarR family transcriptional regulator